MHDFLRTVIVVPMTTKGRDGPYRLKISFAGKTGLLLLDQIRTLDKTRLIRRAGAIDASILDTTLVTLQRMFAPWPDNAS
jgi:mRNA interferase MazF